MISGGIIRDSIIMNNCEIDKNVNLRNSIISSNSSIKQNKIKDEQILLLGEGTKIFF